MRRALYLVASLSLLLTSCGLKVPVTVNAASQNGFADQATDQASTGPSTGTGGQTSEGGKTGIDTSSVGTDLPGATSGMFPNETEGVTKDQITLCTHVPITGAAPLTRDTRRFGQFYFDYVNKELGGIYGRKVRFLAYDDGYSPGTARQAFDKCAHAGSFIYLGAAGTDQIVSVARLAEERKVPYMHGPTSDKDLKGLKYNIFAGPTYEFQSELLADYIAKAHPGAKVGMIRVNSPYFDSGHDHFISQLKKHGMTVNPRDDFIVQKDEQDFQLIFARFLQDDVTVINNFTTPRLWLNALPQKPINYDPVFTAVSPVAGFNIISAALGGQNAHAEVFHHFNPACHCTLYNKDLDPSVPWYNDEREFLRVFGKYSPEQHNPDPDDFDYSAFLAARGLHRILLALGPNPTRTKFYKLVQNYKESFTSSFKVNGVTEKATFPACPGDFARFPGSRRGGWSVNVFTLDGKKWKQTETCITHV